MLWNLFMQQDRASLLDELLGLMHDEELVVVAHNMAEAAEIEKQLPEQRAREAKSASLAARQLALGLGLTPRAQREEATRIAMESRIRQIWDLYVGSRQWLAVRAALDVKLMPAKFAARDSSEPTEGGFPLPETIILGPLDKAGRQMLADPKRATRMDSIVVCKNGYITGVPFIRLPNSYEVVQRIRAHAGTKIYLVFQPIGLPVEKRYRSTSGERASAFNATILQPTLATWVYELASGAWIIDNRQFVLFWDTASGQCLVNACYDQEATGLQPWWAYTAECADYPAMLPPHQVRNAFPHYRSRMRGPGFEFCHRKLALCSSNTASLCQGGVTRL